MCPVGAKKCYKDVIELENGFWRKNNKTDNILFCI